MRELPGKPMKEEADHERISVVLNEEDQETDPEESALNIIMMEIPSDEYRMAETYRYLGE